MSSRLEERLSAVAVQLEERLSAVEVQLEERLSRLQRLGVLEKRLEDLEWQRNADKVEQSRYLRPDAIFCFLWRHCFFSFDFAFIISDRSNNPLAIGAIGERKGRSSGG